MTGTFGDNETKFQFQHPLTSRRNSPCHIVVALMRPLLACRRHLVAAGCPFHRFCIAAGLRQIAMWVSARVFVSNDWATFKCIGNCFLTTASTPSARMVFFRLIPFIAVHLINLGFISPFICFVFLLKVSEFVSTYHLLAACGPLMLCLWFCESSCVLWTAVFNAMGRSDCTEWWTHHPMKFDSVSQHFAPNS